MNDDVIVTSSEGSNAVDHQSVELKQNWARLPCLRARGDGGESGEAEGMTKWSPETRR